MRNAACSKSMVSSFVDQQFRALWQGCVNVWHLLPGIQEQLPIGFI